jgi:hypothetical protein
LPPWTIHRTPAAASASRSHAAPRLAGPPDPRTEAHELALDVRVGLLVAADLRQRALAEHATVGHREDASRRGPAEVLGVARLVDGADVAGEDEDIATEAEYRIAQARDEAAKPSPDRSHFLGYVTQAQDLLKNATAAAGLVTALTNLAEAAQKLF